MPTHFRHFPRQPVNLRASIAHPMAGWQRDIEVIDLGIAGAGLASPLLLAGSTEGLPRFGEGFALSEGERVTLSFHAPNLWDPLTLTARVAWVKAESGRAGVAFEHKSPPSVYALFELLSAFALP